LCESHRNGKIKAGSIRQPNQGGLTKEEFIMEERGYYTAGEVLDILGITYSALRNKVNTGQIRTSNPPGRRQAVYLKEDVDRLKHVDEEPHYTAKEAQEILGMTYSALRNQVEAGTIHSFIPSGKRQAVYSKKDVDQLKSEMEAWLISRHQAKMPAADFVKATPEDMPGAVALAAEVFGGLNTISVEKRVSWLEKNPDIEYLLKQEGQLVGYLTLVPLRPETIEDLMTLRRYAKELTQDDILRYEPNKPVDIYGMAIGVKPGFSIDRKRAYGERLIMGAKKVIIGLGERGIVIRRIIAHSFTPDGIRLMRHIGFTETPPKAPGLRDFMIDIESSGIPFVREYKEALRQWQRKQLTADMTAKVRDDSQDRPTQTDEKRRSRLDVSASK
jgi:hypothetical protein